MIVLTFLISIFLQYYTHLFVLFSSISIQCSNIFVWMLLNAHFYTSNAGTYKVSIANFFSRTVNKEILLIIYSFFIRIYDLYEKKTQFERTYQTILKNCFKLMNISKNLNCNLFIRNKSEHPKPTSTVRT